MKHRMKTWPGPFEAVVEGRKTFEFRGEDRRRFEVGDELVLSEYDPGRDQYTGRVAWRSVTYVLRGPEFGVPMGFAILSLARTERPDNL